MKLPNGNLAIVAGEKLSGYLLNFSHPDNGGKAAFFSALGFCTNQIDPFSAALRKIAANSDVSEVVESEHGTKYILDARLDDPSGRRPWVRTVWVIDRGQSAPRLVTAYPQQEKSDDE